MESVIIINHSSDLRNEKLSVKLSKLCLRDVKPCFTIIIWKEIVIWAQGGPEH